MKKEWNDFDVHAQNDQLLEGDQERSAIWIDEDNEKECHSSASDQLLMNDLRPQLALPASNRQPMRARLVRSWKSWKDSWLSTNNDSERLQQHQFLLKAYDTDDPESDEIWDNLGDYKVGSRSPPRPRWLRWLLMALRALGYLLLSILGLLLIICILYAVVFQTPKRPTAVTPTRTNLTTPARVLTFNIFMRPPGVHNNADDYKDERLAYILNDILPNYDIIALQEAFAFGNHRVDRLIDTALDLGFDYISSVRHGPWSLASDGGLVLLSRFKVLQADTLEYPRGQHSDWLAFKGALHLLVDLDGTSHLHVYTTHTQASYGGHGERTKADILTRLDQFSRFRQFMVQTSAPGTPLLALGDFNIDSAAHDGDNTSPSTNSSLAYTMMMDVLNGKGVDGAYFGMDGWLLAAPDDGSNAGHPLEWIDMLYERYGYHPVTFGDYRRTDNGTLVPAETALTQAQQVMTAQSIDQLLWSPSSVPNASHVTLSAVTIERFLVDHEPFTQLSDHYGVSCELT